MPAALPEPARRDIWMRHQLGQPTAAIAQGLGLDPRSVRRLLHEFHQAGGPTEPAYAHCGRDRSADFVGLYQQAVGLRRQHAAWGAGRILAELSKSRRFESLPDRSTVKRWLQEAGLAPPPRGGARRPAPRGSFAHEIWQMDACEWLALATGERVSWLRLVDEASGAFLMTRVFAQGHWSSVGKHAVREALRDACGHWGRPHGLRVDHGNPWVLSTGGLPSDLELWLAGVGVPLHVNRLYTPQDNGQVERAQGTGKRWAEPQLCQSAEQLQRRVDEEDYVQREVFRDDSGLTRRERFPCLLHSGRGYASSWDAVCWDLEAALGCLAAHRVLRKTTQQGQVKLYDHHHRVGHDYGKQVVEVRFDPAGREWLFLQEGVEVGRSPAAQITEERIRGLGLTRRQGRRTRAKAAP
jgi:hypothetical protein